jgi:hypothetical protein
VGVIQSGGQVKAREESRCQTCLGKGSEFRGWTSLRGGIRVSVLRRLLCRDSSKDHSHSRSLALARGRSVHGRCCSLGNASSQNSRPASGQSGQRNHCPVASGAPTALHPASVFGTARWRLTLPAGHPLGGSIVGARMGVWLARQVRWRRQRGQAQGGCKM